jgi:membrane-bound ClpP family serine protease
MTALGFALLLMGATLVVVEAHVPGGVLDAMLLGRET